MVRLIFKTLFLSQENEKNRKIFYKKCIFFYQKMRQKQKIYILSQENEKNKHSNVKNVSFY